MQHAHERVGVLVVLRDHDLVAAGWAGSGLDEHAFHDLHAPLDHLELAAVDQRLEVVGAVAACAALVGTRGLVQRRALNDVAGVREGRQRAARGRHVGAPTDVLVVQMGVDDDRDVLRHQPELTELPQQGGPAAHRRDVQGQRRLVTGARVHQYPAGGVVDQDAVVTHGDPVLTVRRDEPLPTCLGGGAEEAPAIDPRRTHA